MSNRNEALKDNGSVLNLAHDEFGLNINFSTLSFNQIENTLYNINLNSDDLNLSWENYRKNNILLPKLAPGEHELSISAIYPITGDMSSTFKRGINVAYAPWVTPAAQVFYFVVLMSALFIFVRSRILRNIELDRAYRKAEFNEKRMEMALTSSNSGVWEYDKQTNTYYQENPLSDLGYNINETNQTIDFHLSLVHPTNQKSIESQWKKFVSGEMNYWDVIYQIKSNSNEWFWYKYIGKPISWDKDNIPVKFSGTYTNITEAKANEEQATIFGSAFSQIKDWVLILDSNRLPLTANKAFMDAFQLPSGVSSKTLNVLLTKLGNSEFDRLKSVLHALAPDETWQGEKYIETNTNFSHPVLIKIQAITGDDNKICNYIVVISDITLQKEAEEKLHHIAHYDYLTNLPNRKLIFEQSLNKVELKESNFAVLFIDLDKFKQVNDLYTHKIGDMLLQHVANKLTETVSHRDMVARQSGDEFIILIDKFESLEHTTHLAQLIIDELKKPITIEKFTINISTSLGISIYPSDSNCPDIIIQQADIAMIHAKETGRNQFQFYSEEMNVKAQERLMLEHALQQACTSNLFVNYYQPIVNIESEHTIVGCELLLRWIHQDKFIPPSEFIPIAEETGLIQEMTINAIEKALVDYKAHFSVKQDFYISINLSAVHILQEGLSNMLLTLLAKHNLPTSAIRLEITESAVLSDIDIALKCLQELRNNGFKLLLDDFGTGYSSLTYLSQFPIHYLKIDKSFIDNMDLSVNNSIIQSILYLANNLKLQCIAEGVEEKAQLEALKHKNCHLIQGYYFSKPVPAKEFSQLVLFNT